MDSLIGKQLGKYLIQAEIGRGGMGIVYRGLDTLLHAPVAIKVLPPQLTHDAQFVQRFQQEAVLAASLRGHPGIVTIHDVGQQEGYYYIVMEYLEGVTLEEWLRRNGPMPLRQTAAVVRQIADALDYAHGRRVIHRDVKPANIMIGPQDRATLMDFGLVRAGEGAGLTRAGTILGTPEYMSPEQALGTPADNRSDIYSLGVVVYRMLSGKVPFEGTTPLSITYAHVHQPPPPIRRVRADLPPDLEAVISKALAKQPTDRYQTARGLADDLALIVSGKPPVLAKPAATADPVGPRRTPTPRPGPAKPTPQPMKRTGSTWPYVAGGIIAVLALVLGIIYGITASKPAPVPVFTPDVLPTTAQATSTPAPPPTQPTAAPVATAVRATDAPAQPTATAAAVAVATATRAAPPTQAPATSSPAPPAATSRPSVQCQPWQKQPKPGYGILLVENHIGEDMLLEWVKGGQGQWPLRAKQGDEPGRWWGELPVGHHEFNDSTGRGSGHISVDVQDGQSYISPIWYNDQKEEKLYPMDIPAGCR